jgi:hypothetical protein
VNDWTSLMIASLRQQELLREARLGRRSIQGSTPTRRPAAGLAALPWLTKLGLTLIAAGFLVDLFGGAQPHGEAHLGHLVALVGMALTLAGIVIHGLWTQLSASKEDLSHAIR